MRGHMDQYDPFGKSSTDYMKENPVSQTPNEFFKGSASMQIRVQ